MISAKKGHLKIAIDLLNNGNVDVNPPYTQGSKKPGAVGSKDVEAEQEKMGQAMQDLYREGKTLKESKRKVTYRRKSRK